MEQTGKYGLSQWDAEDRILREDFNADNAKIEAAIKYLETNTTQALAAAGNCRIVTGSYVGTGTYGSNNPNSLTFNFQPKVIFMHTTEATLLHSGSLWLGPFFYLFFQGATAAIGPESQSLKLTWSGNSVSWYTTVTTNAKADYQFNTKNTTYSYIAIG